MASPPMWTVSSRAGGSRRRSRSPRTPSRWPDRSATPIGSRTRSGSRGWPSPRRTCAARRGMGRRRRLHARAPRAVLRRLLRTRRRSPAHVRRRGRSHAGALRRGHRRVPARGQRAAADHHPGERAGTVRAARPSRTGRNPPRRACRGASSMHHVPELGEHRRPGRRQARHDARRGTGGGGGRTRPRRRGRLRAPSDRCRAPRPGLTGPPGTTRRPSRRELEVLRLVADGRTSAEIATRSPFHRGPRSTTCRTSTRRSASPAAPRPTRWAVQHQVVDGPDGS